MCGRYQFDDEKDIAEVKNILENLNGKYDFQVKTGEVFPTNSAAILKAEGNKFILTAMSWGFPKWDNKGVIINAKSETIHEKRMFKNPISQFRCVVPATGFYEWQKRELEKKKDKYLFTSDKGSIVYMAGIYNVFKSQEGLKESFVILTQDANEYMEDIHVRQPVMLYKEELRDWFSDGKFVDFVLHRNDVVLNRHLIET